MLPWKSTGSKSIDSTDFDQDGGPDSTDPDDDNDGIPDNEDQFPQWVDGDLKNKPPDLDGDEKPDLPRSFVAVTYDNSEGLLDDDVTIPQSSDFGWRQLKDKDTGELKLNFHGAIDLDTFGGESIHASFFVDPVGAVVHFAGNGSVIGFGPGKAVVIRNVDGTFSLYAHLASMNVSTGQPVSSLDVVGKAGTKHVHYGEFTLELPIGDATAIDPQREAQPGD